MDVLLAVLLVVFFAILFLHHHLSREENANLPPGPRGKPLVGSWFDVDQMRPYLTYTKWRQQFGDLIMFRRGRTRFVLLNSYSALKAAYVDQASIFSARPKLPYVRLCCRDSGILNTDGPVWSEHRRFLLRVLRDFGVGRATSEGIIQTELAILKKSIAAAGETPVDSKSLFMSATSNVIARITFGETFDVDSEEYASMLEAMKEVTTRNDIWRAIPIFLPVITRFPALLRWVEAKSSFRQSLEKCHDFTRERLAEQSKALGTDVKDMDLSQARTVCEALLIEKERQESNRAGSHSFSEWQLIRDVGELFIAGTDTSATTLSWAMLYLANNCEVQDKVHAEIDAVIGHHRGPVMKDRSDLPYVNAVLDEAARRGSIAPLSLLHAASCDTKLLGFLVPKRVPVIANLYGIHHDPNLWEKPDEFYPEHFLTPDGRYKPSEFLNPFSVGKRACLGEMLARMELFLFFVGVMQRWSVTMSDHHVDVTSVAMGRGAVIRTPGDHHVIFKARN